jgi:hypothetical protein
MRGAYNGMRSSFLLHRAFSFSSREDGEGAMKVAKLKIPTNNLASMGKGALCIHILDILDKVKIAPSTLLHM